MKSKITTSILFFVLLGVLAAFRFFSHIDTTVYQCDEYSYLQKSYFLDLYLSGKFSDPSWQNGDATDQTKLMEYVYGCPSKILYQKDFIGLASQEGQKDNKSYINYSDWAVSYGQPAKNLKVSPKLKNVLYTGRLISASLTIIYLLLCSCWSSIFHSYFTCCSRTRYLMAWKWRRLFMGETGLRSKVWYVSCMAGLGHECHMVPSSSCLCICNYCIYFSARVSSK